MSHLAVLMRHLLGEVKLTPSFLKEYEEARISNGILSFEEKMHIWSFCTCEWQTGKKPYPYIPFPEAEKIHRSIARYLMISAGNRFAKSLIAAMEAVAAMMVPGANIWLVAPQLRLAANGEWPYIYNCIMDSGLWDGFIKPKIRELLIQHKGYKKEPTARAEKEQYDKQVTMHKYISCRDSSIKELTIKWPGAPNSHLATMSYNNQKDWIKLEGANVTMMIFPEGSRVPLKVWVRHLEKRLSDTAGRVIIPCTAKGRDQFLYPMFQKGLSVTLKVDIDYNNCNVTHTYVDVPKGEFHVENTMSYMDSYETFHYAAIDNPYYNMKDYESDCRALFSGELDESTFLERMFGMFTSYSGLYYTGLNYKTICKKSYDVQIPKNATHYVTIDPGRATYAAVEFFYICKPDENGISKWIFYDEIYEKDMWVEKLVDKIKEKTKYKVRKYICDRTDERKTHHHEHSVQDRMRELGLEPMTCPWEMKGNTIDRLNRWKPRLFKEEIVILEDKCPRLVLEMQELEYADPVVTAGKQKNVSKLVGDTHALDSVTYAHYCTLRWIDYVQEEEEAEARKPKVHTRNSVAYFLAREERRNRTSIHNLIGTL